MTRSALHSGLKQRVGCAAFLHLKVNAYKMSEKKSAKDGKLAKWNKLRLFLKLFFCKEITPFDFDPLNFGKAIDVLHLHRTKEVAMHTFTRVSWRLFYDNHSRWGYDIVELELD
jgi:hypothetical protein